MEFAAVKYRGVLLHLVIAAGIVSTSGCRPDSSPSVSSPSTTERKDQNTASTPDTSNAAPRIDIPIPGQYDVTLGGEDVEIKGRVDSAADTFTITSWTDQGGRRWTPQASQLPFELRAFNELGTPFDVPEKWDGELAGFAFLLPADRDVTTIVWNEGVPEAVFKGSSFGWGGLRNSTGKVVLFAHKPGASPSNREFFKYVPAGRATTDIRFKQATVTQARQPAQ